MNDLAALIPPFLMCAVVIIAIFAFLRHEMGRGRQGRRDPDDDISGSAVPAAAKIDGDAGSDADTSASAGRDG
jgi:hypothetical protein